MLLKTKKVLHLLFLLLGSRPVLAQHRVRTEAYALAYLSCTLGKSGVYASIHYGQIQSESRERNVKDQKGSNRIFASRAAFLHYMIEQGWEFVSSGAEEQDLALPGKMLFKRRVKSQLYLNIE